MLTFRAANPILVLETRPRGDLRVAPKALSLFLSPSRCTWVRHVTDSPHLKHLAIPVPGAAELQTAKPVQEFPPDFLMNRLFHSVRRKSERPVHTVDAQVRRLN